MCYTSGMIAPLLLTKFHIAAPRADLVPRLRLLEQMETSGKLSLICAPAGFGKTTLASCLLAQQNCRVAWLSLDEADNDLQRFFTYFISALNRIDPSIGQTSLEMLQLPDTPAFATLLSHLINDLAQSAHDYILALDDYHLIQNQGIHKAFTFLLENQPPQLHLVIISRVEPPLPLVKLRAKNQLVELNTNDLRFTQAETEIFLNQTMKLGLSEEQIAQLESKTEGWITGLQLVALSLKNTADANRLVQTLAGDHRYVADYLIDEVLSQQPQEIQQFLLKTSILNRLCPDLCNAVTGIENSQAILDILERANLFLIPLDDTRRWYRYHHLFADMLRHRLETQQGALLPQLYRRAFEWHDEANLQIQAVHYALQGEMYIEAAGVVAKIGHRTYWRNLADKVGEWLQKIPDSILDTHPQLHILRVLVLIDRGEIRAVEAALEHLENYLAEHSFLDEANRLEFEGQIRAMQSAVAYHRYFDGAMTATYSDRALEILPETFPFDRCVAAFHSGGAYLLLGDLDEARDRLAESFRLSNITGTPLDKMLAQSNLGKVELAAGNLDRARHYFSQTYKMATEFAVRQGSTFSDALTGLGLVHYLQNDLETAQVYIDSAINISQADEFLDRLLLAYVALIQVYHARGDVDRASVMLQDIMVIMTGFDAPPNIHRRLEVEQARLWFVGGNKTQAERWAAEQSNLIASYENEAALLLVAQICLVQTDYERAAKILTALLTKAEQQGRFNSVIHLEILLAQTCQLQKKTHQTMVHLQQAIELAQPQSITRPFLDVGFVLGELLSKLIRAETLAPAVASFVQNILSELQVTLNTTTPTAQSAPTATQLTPREVEVLYHLSVGFTYAQIAEQMVITENTLKYHVKNIYGKLGVNNRVQAITIARELQLL